MPAEAVLATLRTVIDSLRKLDVPAALMGGLALAAWNRVRSTQDVDLLISLRGVRTQSLLAHLASAGFRAKGSQPFVRLEQAEFIQLLYEPPGTFLAIQVDLMLAENPFLDQAIQNRVLLPSSELAQDVAVLRCEDLIVLKLLAGRILDLVDAAALIQANREFLDFAHLQTWIQHFDLRKPFAVAWSEAYPGEAPQF